MRVVSIAIIVCIAAAPGLSVAAPFGPPAPVAAKATPALQTIALYREEYAHWQFKPCQPARANEIVVCGSGRRGSPDRIPFPDEAPGASPADALTVGGSCRSANCPGHGVINPVQVAVTAVQVVRAIIDPEGASDYADRHPWNPDK